MKSVVPLSVCGFDLATLRKSLKADLSSKSTPPVESLAILARMINQLSIADDHKAVEKSGDAQKHLYYGFLIAADEERKNLWLEFVSVELSVIRISDGYALIATGSLRDWRRTLIDNLVPNRSPILRDQLKHVFAWFETLELASIFNGYRREFDTSLYLEPKK